jgi:hypothetical protein
MSEERIPEFEDRLRMLLVRTAEAIPDDTDIALRVRQATRRARSTGGLAGPRSLLAAVAAVLVVVLLASVLLFVRPLGPLRPAGGVIARQTGTATALPTPVGSPPVCNIASLHNYSRPPAAVDHSVAVGRSASVNGITITIDRAYADATQTIISYHMETNINPPSPWNPVLIDAQGQRFALFSGVWSIDSVSYFAFTPLPPAELGMPLTLTFFAPQMQVDLPEPTAKAALVDGPWQITFSLVPEAGTSYTLSNAPVVA